MKTIMLSCTACGATKKVRRLSGDPQCARVIETLCDAHGSVDDIQKLPFRYLDEAGNEIDISERLAS